jgi:hypothetical protein
MAEAFSVLDWVDANLDGARPSAGDEWTATCPYCGEFGGFYINTDPEKQGPHTCFKCKEKSGSVTKLIAHVEDITLFEARALVMSRTMEFRRAESTESLLDRIRAIRSPDSLDDLDLLADDTEESEPLPREFIPVWNGKRWRIPTYLTRRGFKRNLLRKWNIGFCQTGYFAHRIIIPFKCPNGESFTARDLSGEQEPKYLNPSGVDHARLLIGWDQVPPRGDFVLVEGPTDAMKLDQHGSPAMAVGGKVLSASQLSMLFQRPEDSSVTVMFDPEALAEAYSVAQRLCTHFTYVFIATLPAGVDPGSATAKQARRSLGKAKRYRGERAPKVAAVIAAMRENVDKKYGARKKG